MARIREVKYRGRGRLPARGLMVEETEETMKSLLAAGAAVVMLAAAPAFAADTDTNANATGAKPSAGAARP